MSPIALPQQQTPMPKGEKEKRIRVKVAQVGLPAQYAPRQAGVVPVVKVIPQASPATHYIQIASFRTDKYARMELERLRTKGYQSFLATKGNFRIVCVGGYGNKADATLALKQLKKTYADCILRNR